MDRASYLAGAPEPGDYELRHRALARRAAAEGMVLLKNDGILPLNPGRPVALYGMGAVATVLGGKGSGEVNARDSVSVARGLAENGFAIQNAPWLRQCRQVYDRAREEWRARIWRLAEEHTSLVEAYFGTPFVLPPCPPLPEPGCDTAIYVLSRNAGEGKDREPIPGDYFLTREEIGTLTALAEDYAHVVLLINSGGIVDLSGLPSGIGGILLISQPGMEGGNAVADVLLGRVCPCGKLTDSWPLDVHPCLTPRNREQTARGQVAYSEDIYVGYRYFDTFRVPVRYGFGFGLSYTRFSVTRDRLSWDPETNRLSCLVTVKNTGAIPGREVVQLYLTCPDRTQPKEFRRLAAFGKTPVLAPGAQCRMSLTCPISAAASYQEGGYALEAGNYPVWVGNSLENSRPVGAFRLDAPVIVRPCRSLWPDVNVPDVLTGPRDDRRQAPELLNLPVVEISARSVRQETAEVPQIPEQYRKIAEALTPEQQIRLCVGAEGRGIQAYTPGVRVPGAAGETVDVGSVPSLILADGPAGLRLPQIYSVSEGRTVPVEFCFEKGFLAREDQIPSGDLRYQFCTAFPVGTALAQTWDPALAEEVGRAVGEEMRLFSVHLWLAPGMNIHRDPLCGRNFEYYSEDPLVSGLMAAAVIRGTQSCPGCGVTVKHFACNNQETLRTESNSIVSERALREIYLKGFELAVRDAQPAAIMTGYNQVNGIHDANSPLLCTEIARREWGFRGLIMTDWGTTYSKNCSAAACIRAGNDLLMPGSREDLEELLSAAPTLPGLSLCAARVIAAALQLNGR